MCMYSDVDECANEVSPCGNIGETCVNTVGSYRCDCAEGFQRRQRKCEPKPPKKGMCMFYSKTAGCNICFGFWHIKEFIKRISVKVRP